MTTLTVTAMQGGATFAGMAMRIRVMTGAAAVAAQTGGSAQDGGGSTSSVSITTTRAGSLVYGAMGNQGSCATGEMSTTIVDNFSDTTNGQFYGSFRTATVTGTPGATIVGSTVSNAFGSIAAQEILPAGTITEDLSSPAVATTVTATALTSGSFSPPAGSLIVVMIQCDGSGTGLETCTVTDAGAGLTWIEKANTSGITDSLYAGVWLADVPSGGAPPASRQYRQAVRRAAFY